MKTIIKQILKETAVDKFIDSVVPQLNNLKTKSNYNSRKYGNNIIYYNKDDKGYYFRVLEPRPRYITNDEGKFKRDGMTPKRLYIDSGVYNEIIKFIPYGEIDIMILKWFNEKYKQNAEEINHRYLKDI
jgi:hypothetical protein